MQRRQRRVGGIGIALAVLAAACGSSGADGTATTAPSGPTEESVATQASSTPDTAAESSPVETDGATGSDDPVLAQEPYALDLPGGATLIVPAGAPEGITATAVDDDAPDGFTTLASFELAPSGLVFDEPVQLEVPLPEPPTNVLVAYSGVLAGADGAEEFVAGDISDDGIATVEINHFSRVSIRRFGADQPVAISALSVGELAEFGRLSVDELTESPRFDLRSTPQRLRGLVEIDVRDTVQITCLAPGAIDEILVLRGPTGELFGAQARLLISCESPSSVSQVTADQVSNTENHTDASLLKTDLWFSAWLAKFSSLSAGMAASVVDVGCDGVGVDDVVVFGPEMIQPDGRVTLGLERFGCNALLVLPADADVSAVMIPYVLDEPPVQRDDGSWTVPGMLDELGASFVTHSTTGSIASWTVTGTDGPMPQRP